MREEERGCDVVAQVQEVGDGNINFVYIVKGPQGALCLKQGLPFLRIAHDWPLTQVTPLLLLLPLRVLLHHDFSVDLPFGS